ncbi:RNA polymerase sigma factor [Maribellus maritimus]|uniref:RNA polymerase sigma factor n=1 Tax=Maribellus maritimus TaxID=2870838 RepID=UPI001EE9E915|nr:sigma-70 family RNA polymerase sigma factor [Maribellus maritimus]MCG6188596.1 sigma-70 family RNA polymerase sigma factor [Maribellus maritimus]
MQSDEELWKNFLSGDKEAFKLIYEKSVSDLSSYGARFSSNHELIKDCIQDLFIDLYNKRSGLGLTNKIMPYLMVSLKRIIFKKTEEEKNGKLINIEQLAFNFDLAEEEKSTDENHPDVLQIALNSLTPRQREAIYLKYVLEFDYNDLAKVLNLNYQTARNLIYRSILKLRENLKDDNIILLFSIFKR